MIHVGLQKMRKDKVFCELNLKLKIFTAFTAVLIFDILYFVPSLAFSILVS